MKRKVGCGLLGVFVLLVLGVMVARPPAAVPVPTLIPEKAATVVLPTATEAAERAPAATSAAYAPPTPSAMSDAELHSGPGTNYPVVGRVAADEALVVIGQNEKGDWYLLESGGWISVYVMLNAPYADVVSDYAAPPDTCDRCIKGNISVETGDRIFHAPGCDNYEETDIDAALGERWFSSEAEAIAAGWRKAQNCP